MGYLEFGTTSGLAVRNNYDADMDRALNLKQLQRQAHIDAQNKAALLDYESGKAVDPYNSKMLDALVKKNASSMASIAIENPNWDTDPAARNQVLQLKREMLDNQFTRNSMSLQQHKKDLDDFSAKTPGALQMPEIQEMYRQYDMNAKNGSIDPTGKQFTFMNPLDTFDIDLDMGEHAKNLGTTEVYDQSVNGGRGATVTTVPNERLMEQAHNILTGSPNRLKYMARWSHMDDATKSYYNNDPQKWVAEGLKTKVDYKIDPGKFLTNGTGSSGKPGVNTVDYTYSPFVAQIQNQPKNVIGNNHDIYSLSTAYQDGDSRVINPAEPLRIRTKGPDGKPSWITLESYGNTPIKVSETENFMNDENGRTMIEYSARVPVKKELVNKGLLGDRDAFWHGGTWGGPDDYVGTDFEDVESSKDVVHLERNGDVKGYTGSDTDQQSGHAIVKFWYPAATGESHRSAFDKAQKGQNEANDLTPTRLNEASINQALSVYEGKVVKAPDGNNYLVRNGTLIKQ